MSPVLIICLVFVSAKARDSIDIWVEARGLYLSSIPLIHVRMVILDLSL